MLAYAFSITYDKPFYWLNYGSRRDSFNCEFLERFRSLVANLESYEKLFETVCARQYNVRYEAQLE